MIVGSKISDPTRTAATSEDHELAGDGSRSPWRATPLSLLGRCHAETDHQQKPDDPDDDAGDVHDGHSGPTRAMATGVAVGE
jgi:hypothetical protein